MPGPAVKQFERSEKFSWADSETKDVKEQTMLTYVFQDLIWFPAPMTHSITTAPGDRMPLASTGTGIPMHTHPYTYIILKNVKRT